MSKSSNNQKVEVLKIWVNDLKKRGVIKPKRKILPIYNEIDE